MLGNFRTTWTAYSALQCSSCFEASGVPTTTQSILQNIFPNQTSTAQINKLTESWKDVGPTVSSLSGTAVTPISLSHVNVPFSIKWHISSKSKEPTFPAKHIFSTFCAKNRGNSDASRLFIAMTIWQYDFSWSFYLILERRNRLQWYLRSTTNESKGNDCNNVQIINVKWCEHSHPQNPKGMGKGHSVPISNVRKQHETSIYSWAVSFQVTKGL